MHLALLSWLSSLALAAAAPAGGAAGHYVLLDVGNYLQKDLAKIPQARDRNWLALCRKGASVSLIDVVIEVRPFRSGAVNDGPKQQSGREIVVADCPEPLVLMRGPGLHAGKLSSVEHDDGKFAFAGAEYVVRRDLPGPEPEDDCGKKKVHLVLTSGAQKQTLAEADFCTLFDVRFAGDLDGDGKLDLVVADHLDSGATLFRLYLSKDAGPKAALRQVTTFLHKP
jgi:hypothetical protein